MRIKQADFERIEPDFGSSFTLRKFDQSQKNAAPRWHNHPELELVYIKEGSGKRHVGQHIEQYDDGDLILLGPNLPHFGFTDRFAKSSFEIVLHFKYEFLGEGFFDATEMNPVKQLLKLSSNGLSFSGNIKDEIGERLESMFYMTAFEKMVELVKILFKLSATEEMKALHAKEVMMSTKSVNTERLDLLFNHVRNRFQSEIPLEEVSQLIHMTVPSFCRYFKSHTNKTFIEFLQQYRITHACKLLVESEESITDICFESGFNNFSHFNKIFKRFTQKSPSQYRKDASLNIAKR